MYEGPLSKVVRQLVELRNSLSIAPSVPGAPTSPSAVPLSAHTVASIGPAAAANANVRRAGRSIGGSSPSAAPFFALLTTLGAVYVGGSYLGT